MLALCLLFFVKNSYADMVLPAILHQFMISMIVPFYYSVILAVLIVSVETFFLQRLFTTKKSLFNFILNFVLSFIINLLSSILGALILVLLNEHRGDIFSGVFGYADMRLGTYLGMIPGYALTVLIEGILLFLIAQIINLIIERKLKFISCMKTSIIMNCCSYLILLIGVIIVDIMTKGSNFYVR